jgi:hypothetical protein
MRCGQGFSLMTVELSLADHVHRLHAGNERDKPLGLCNHHRQLLAGCDHSGLRAFGMGCRQVRIDAVAIGTLWVCSLSRL